MLKFLFPVLLLTIFGFHLVLCFRRRHKENTTVAVEVSEENDTKSTFSQFYESEDYDFDLDDAPKTEVDDTKLALYYYDRYGIFLL